MACSYFGIFTRNSQIVHGLDATLSSSGRIMDVKRPKTDDLAQIALRRASSFEGGSDGFT